MVCQQHGRGAHVAGGIIYTRGIGSRGKAHCAEVTFGIYIDALTIVTVLEHGAIIEDVVPLNAINWWCISIPISCHSLLF